MSDSRRAITLKFDSHDYRGLIKAMNDMDKAANTSLRDEVSKISGWVARDLKREVFESPFPAQAGVVARSIRVKRDRFPSISIGGNTAKTKHTGVGAGVLLFGNEFGAKLRFPNGGRRFPFPKYGATKADKGFWIFPFLHRSQKRITTEWKSAVDRHVTGKWADHG